ncbi:MAG TPA: hypothetical protein DHV62_10285 [Elusimicrobia bacterium]|jgi:predicted transcriptional regulator of viral defense system|nr:hypothetical protein [Elusimicrobiota bacterium]
MVKQRYILSYIKELHRPIFTTNELSSISGKSLSVTTQALNYLKRQNIIFKIYHGIWGETGENRINAYSIIPFLFRQHRAYVSFVSALHLYGIVEQIPQVITLASTAHTKIIKTSIATYSVHRLAPSFFGGFRWYNETGDFLIAEPEKALVDSIYLSARKKKQFLHFPELLFPKSFNFKRTKMWVERIPDRKLRQCVGKRLNELLL